MMVTVFLLPTKAVEFLCSLLPLISEKGKRSDDMDPS